MQHFNKMTANKMPLPFFKCSSMLYCFHTDRPSPPRNLAVSDIKAESCYLTWDTPLDNGGSEITHYIIEKRDASKKKSEWEEVSKGAVERRFGVIYKISSLNSLVCIKNNNIAYVMETATCIGACAHAPFRLQNYWMNVSHPCVYVIPHVTKQKKLFTFAT